MGCIPWQVRKSHFSYSILPRMLGQWALTRGSYGLRGVLFSCHGCERSGGPAQTGMMVMKHEDIWRAIDALAAENGLSASGLAKKSGLDPTTFNRSKRRTADGHERWPGTESVSKILNATGASLESFTALVTGTRALSPGAVQRIVHRRIPLIGFAQAGGAGFFDDGGYPVGGSWDEVSLPEIGDPNAYALEISGDSMEPVYRGGDQGIVSPAPPIR